LQNARTRQANFVTIPKMPGGQRHKVTDNILGLLLVQAMGLRQFGCHLLERYCSLGRRTALVKWRR
jgi:hypothetical protein